MKIDRQECPGCGSEQAFRPQWRYHREGERPTPNDWYITIFIACIVCPWSKDIEISTTKIEHLRNRLRRHKALAEIQQQQFGSVQPHTEDAITRLHSDIVFMRNHYINGKIWT